MKLKQAQQIIEHHLEWIKSDKTGEYKYTESAFNEALEVVFYNSRKTLKQSRDMSKLKIEDGIPISDKLFVRRSKYSIMTKMKVGQSVFVECSKSEAKSESSKCRSYINSYGRKQNPIHKYSFRTVDGGFRVWRIK